MKRLIPFLAMLAIMVVIGLIGFTSAPDVKADESAAVRMVQAPDGRVFNMAAYATDSTVSAIVDSFPADTAYPCVEADGALAPDCKIYHHSEPGHCYVNGASGGYRELIGSGCCNALGYGPDSGQQGNCYICDVPEATSPRTPICDMDC